MANAHKTIDGLDAQTLKANIPAEGQVLSEYAWGDGCYAWNYVDTDELSVKRELMPPGTAEQLHYHQFANQVFVITKGKADFWVDGETISIKANQGLEIKAGLVHRISNNGDNNLEFILRSMPSTRNDRHSPNPKTTAPTH